MRQPATAELLTLIGTRGLQLSHEAFDAMPPSRSLEHLREMSVSHRMMPDRGDRHLARFERWLDQRLQTLQDTPTIATPIEQFARWHHLRRLRENDNPARNMDNATRCAKQEITEAGKFLTWLLTEHDTTIDDLAQGQLDAYLSEGTTTRTAIRNFIQRRARAGIAPPFKTRYRVAARPRWPPHDSASISSSTSSKPSTSSFPRGSPHCCCCSSAHPSNESANSPSTTSLRPPREPPSHSASCPPHPPGATPPLSSTPQPAGESPDDEPPRHLDIPRGHCRTTYLGVIIHAPASCSGSTSKLHAMHTHDLTKEIDPVSLADLLGYSTPSHEHPRRACRSPHGHLPRHQPPSSTPPKQLNSTLLKKTDIQRGCIALLCNAFRCQSKLL